MQLLLLFGGLGAHRFYMGEIPMGILYLFKFGLFFVGRFYDLFNLSTKVDNHNLRVALYRNQAK
ncbi:NINE protein [Hazenella sp. IB182357]|uniref:NINE protein n=1 Tax=Polycladospora coralii TaxID=2771432 RepID=A0A926NAE0_9BACL|nr:NINE protein [Polycladospora coralii]MBD1371585.1 NINE protein [Polycladospora coralii]MBS7529052.1 NINE protein [Polycladospora coralii]